jgi:PPIC-type PPIASE domain
MRRFVILLPLIAAAVAACSNFRELFAAHADVAAEVGPQELSAQRLSQIVLGSGKNIKVTRDVVQLVADIWVDYSLFGQALVRGKLPTDSVAMTEVLWPELAEIKGTHWHDTLMARRSSISDTAADSLYRTPETRLLQHILFGVRPNVEPAKREETRKKAQATLTKLKGGANFSRLASQLSEDPGSRADSGYLPPGPKGRFVAVFDSVGWALAPGQTSGIVESPFGYHIIKRPGLKEVRNRIDDYLAERAGVRLDSLYMDSLAAANQIEVMADAPVAMRAAAASPEDARGSQKVLTRYKGGTLTVQNYIRWVRALPPQYGNQLRQANDSMLNRFARVLTQNVLLLREADRGGMKITPLEWASLERRYRAQLDTLRTEMDLGGPELTDSSVAVGEREKLAGLKVEQYFDRLIAGKTKLRPLPSALATLLRERLPFKVYDAGVNRGLDIAMEAKAKADSVSPPQGAMRPAPGPAPFPGAQPPAAARPDTSKPSAKPGPATPGSKE